MNRRHIETLLSIDTGTYGWIADVWPTIEGMSEGVEPADHVEMGPEDISAELTARLKAGEGRVFRCLDDDRNVYFEGRLIIEREDPDDETDFHPLYDLGEGYGCVDIQYRTENENGDIKWVSL